MAIFVPYLIVNDYLPTIQQGQFLEQLLDALKAGNMQRVFAESWAISQIRSYLKKEIDVESEITPTLPWNSSKPTYLASERVVIDYDDWITIGGYAEGDCVIQDGIGYVCVTANSDVTFTIGKWESLGEKYSIYYIPYPENLFSLNLVVSRGSYTDGYYKKDDIVYWNNHTYKAKTGTSIIDSDTALNYEKYRNIPPPNIFPDFPNNTQWEDLGAYSATNLRPGLGDWVLGDNRDPTFIKAAIDLSLWMLHSRIAPQNIPILRENNKNAVFAWMKDLRKNLRETDVQKLQPLQGQNFRGGSNIKNQNGYG